MSTDRDNLAAILLAVATRNAEWRNTSLDRWQVSGDDWEAGYIRDNIARFRIKPEAVDVVGALKIEIDTAACHMKEHALGSRAYMEASGLFTRLTALAESIRGMQG